MSTDERKLLLVGLETTGKSTYLAALWHCVESPSADTALYAPRLQDDREYLNRIRDSWLACKEVGRTSVRGGETHAAMLLEERQTQKRVRLFLPDLSGEAFHLQWAARTARREYVEYAKRVHGLLVFLHPLFHKTTARIEPGTPPSEVGNPPKEDDTNWDPASASTQVQTVDLLQMILSIRHPCRPLPTALVVSAWDKVDGLTPHEWMSREAPLLDQFLSARRDVFDYSVFGVSAQGGDLDTDAERLASIQNPHDRIRVVQDDQESSDITIPVAWTLEKSATK